MSDQLICQVSCWCPRCCNLSFLWYLHHDHHCRQLYISSSWRSCWWEEWEQSAPHILRLHLHLHLCNRDASQGTTFFWQIFLLISWSLKKCNLSTLKMFKMFANENEKQCIYKGKKSVQNMNVLKMCIKKSNFWHLVKKNKCYF